MFVLWVVWMILPFAAGGGALATSLTSSPRARASRSALLQPCSQASGTFGGTNLLMGSPYFGGDSEPAAQEYVNLN